VHDRETREHANYLPQPSAQRLGIGLCLSGGGYRAALFHLGALRRLNEFGVLGQLRTISSVSGGSIMAAHLAARVKWPLQGALADWEDAVGGPLRKLTATNIRTGALLQKFLPWNWFRESPAVAALTKSYERELTALPLSALPDQPKFVLCATDMSFGVNWVFEKNRMGSYLAGYASVPPHDWPLARAVAASSCFPPVFNPMPTGFLSRSLRGGRAARGDTRSEAIKGLRLTDGGVYDCLGLEPVWKDHAVVLVSDAGGGLDYEGDRNLLWRLERYIAIMGGQAQAVRKRWVISDFIAGILEGAYWGVRSATTSYESGATGGYSKDLAVEVIAKIRTDLDAFSEAEASVLENHGYLLADAAIKRHLPHLVPTPPPALAVPHPEWMHEEKVRRALRESGKMKLLGRW